MEQGVAENQAFAAFQNRSIGHAKKMKTWVLISFWEEGKSRVTTKFFKKEKGWEKDYGHT